MNFPFARDNHVSYAQAKKNIMRRGFLGIVLVFLAVFGFYYNAPGQALSGFPTIALYLILLLGLIICVLALQSAFNARARNKHVNAPGNLYDPDNT